MNERALPKAPDFAAVFAALPQATALFAADAPEFTLLAVSDALLALARRPRDALIGKPLALAFPPANPGDPGASGLTELRASLVEAMRTGTPQHMDRQRYDLQLPGGNWETRYWQAVNIPLPGTDGAVRHLLHQTADITALVRGEAATAQAASAERRAERIIERMGDAHCVLDREFRMVSVNAATERVLGRPRETLLGRSQWEVFPASFDAPVGHALRRVVAEGIEQHFTHHYAGEGYDFHLEVSAYPTEGGGVAVFWRDVTEQVKTAEALRDSEAKFRTIAEAMPQMVWSTRPDGYHDYYNEQWYRFTGVSRDSTHGDAWNGLFHPDDQPRAWAAWRHSLATGERYEIQYRLRHHTGEYRWTLGRALPVRDEGGRIVRWMGTCTDIHDQKLAEDALKRQSERKDEFLAMLAHELRNPLAPISTAAHLLKLTRGDQSRVTQLSDVISRQVNHMTNLVDDLLDVSRVTRGLVELTMATVDMKSVLNHAIEQVRPLIESRQHELQLRVASAPAHVLGDQTRLVQVIANLLNNAAKYTPPGGLVSVALGVHDDVVRIEVRDTGTGISPALLPYVFDLFSQGERSPDRAQGGLGLGLSLVKQLTSLHGGEIGAASGGLAQGSTFTLTLPLAAPAPVRATRDEPVIDTAGALEPRTVLVVDDNADAATALGALLELDGHVVSVLNESGAVLAWERRGEIEVFILDIGLPEMDGYELARRLRSDPSTREGLLIALTGYGQSTDRERSKAAGFDHHLVKPVDVAVLRELMTRQPGSRSDADTRRS